MGSYAEQGFLPVLRGSECGLRASRFISIKVHTKGVDEGNLWKNVLSSVQYVTRQRWFLVNENSLHFSPIFFRILIVFKKIISRYPTMTCRNKRHEFMVIMLPLSLPSLRVLLCIWGLTVIAMRWWSFHFCYERFIILLSRFPCHTFVIISELWSLYSLFGKCGEEYSCRTVMS